MAFSIVEWYSDDGIVKMEESLKRFCTSDGRARESERQRGTKEYRGGVQDQIADIATEWRNEDGRNQASKRLTCVVGR